MAAYVVTYDLNNETKRPQIVSFLRQRFPDSVKFSESSYGIESPLGPKDVYDTFSFMLDGDDVLLVIHIANPWWGKAPETTYNWLHSHLRDCRV